MKKKDLGLPHESEATDRQRRDGMCWRDPDEPYNGGGAFKVACRDERGVMVTIIADNYYGYCKKEVKTQISFAANLFRLVRRGARRRRDRLRHLRSGPGFPRRASREPEKGSLSATPCDFWGRWSKRKPEGYAIDRRYPDILYVPEDAEFSVREGSVRWKSAGTPHDSLTLARRCHLRAALRLPPAHGEAVRRLGLAAGRRAPARHAVPQALHGFRRRQIGNFEIHRQRDPRRPGIRPRLSSRHRAGGRNPEEGFLAASTRTARPMSAPAGRS